jgi:hypothetical protein
MLVVNEVRLEFLLVRATLAARVAHERVGMHVHSHVDAVCDLNRQ